MLNFKSYLSEEFSKDELEKAKEAGHSVAKEVFGDEYDEDKANETIDGVIEKYKDNVDGIEDLVQIVVNSFRG